ncbi:MAG: hypothetical protein ACM3PW_07635 [Chlamydiota bacterium]
MNASGQDEELLLGTAALGDQGTGKVSGRGAETFSLDHLAQFHRRLILLGCLAQKTAIRSADLGSLLLGCRAFYFSSQERRPAQQEWAAEDQ